ncbi:MAG: sigma 54-interacting transcriptional regulator, partial [Planctomycetota bacterium]
MKILVVDDERTVRDIMLRGLRREGHDAYAAETAEDAEALLADHPDIPLVLTDIRLPGRSGLELLQTAKATNPAVEVALMTGYAGLDSAAEAVGAHAFAYLRKPLRLEEVLAVVDQVGERLAMRKEREQHRRELEQLVGRLEMSEERYRTLVEGIPGAAILTDSELVVRSASRRCRDVLGRSPDELVGTRIDALRADDADAFRERVERLRRGAGTVARFEGSVKHPERSRVPTVEVITSVAAGDAGSGGVFWIVQDASTEQALRREAERARDYLAAMRRSRSEEVEIVGESRPIKQVLRLIKDAAPTGAAVLVTGETGTGKELVAESIHINSDRADEPFVVVNCAALPETLLESELFGYRKGAFTGAVADKPGLVEIADGGTLFVDEVGDMALSVQSKLLRVLERGQFRRLG